MPKPTFLDYRDSSRAGPPRERDGEPFDPQAARRRWLRHTPPRPEGRYVLYWMQMAQRARSNLALTEAIRRAEALEKPLVVYQGLNRGYPGASARIHRFVLEDARDVAEELLERGIRYVFYLQRDGDDRRAAAEMIREAAFVVVDDYPAFILPGITRKAVALTEDSAVPVLAFDGHGVVPLAEVGAHQFAARTIRPRLHRRLPEHLHPVPEVEPSRRSESLGTPVQGIEADLRGASEARLDALVGECDVDPDVLPSLRYRGGRREALRRLEVFVAEGLPRYADVRSDPSARASSELSPYLHFGCLSAQEVALAVLHADAPAESIDDFLEELIVRRELAANHCRYAEPYQGLGALPDWAKKTMAEHRADARERVFSEADLEAGRTDDPLWNAAQRELVATGTIQSYLRMLWGKHLIRWTRTYEDAHRLMLDWHDRYALDGRDPNTYANVLWLFGLHDRAFGERPVLGKLRPMTSASTRKKFKVQGYLDRVAEWVAERDMPVLRPPEG